MSERIATTADIAERLQGRDRVVDLIRVASIAVVVLGHWLMAVVTWEDGAFTGRNALDLIPGLWALTWVLQVMPLFFFVGGFANAAAVASAARRGTGYTGYARARAERLLAPTLPFVAVWLGVSAVANVLGLDALSRGLALVAQPLWFLAVYVGVCAIAPAMLRLHERARWRVPAALALGALAVDLLARASGVPALGLLNFATTWLFAHQLGFFLADGTLASWPRARFAATAAGSLLGLVALTAPGWYPASMVTLDEGRSNVTPPTVCIVLLSVWLVSLAMLARPALARWMQRPRAYGIVAVLGSSLMTLFLWHLTALLLAVLLLLPLGFPQPEAGTASWWALRPVWLGALLVHLAVLVRLTARWEHAPMRAGRPVGAGRAAAGALVLGASFAALAQVGFARLGVALAATGGLLAGRALLGGGVRR